jgi:hypothetical protein
MKLLPVVLAMAVLAPAAAHAGPASDAVKFFYSPAGYEPDPKVRDRFVDPAKAKFEENDKIAAGGEACIDWMLGVDAQDFDQAELDKTLKLTETVTGDTAAVDATFSLLPGGDADSKREVVWSLKKVGADWKVSDIESKTNDWKLSELKCE